MKKLLYALMLSLSLSASADIMVTNLNTIYITAPQMVQTVTTNAIPVKDVKVIWTSFTINYLAPTYTQAVYSVSYILQDIKTKRDIPGSRGFARLTEKEVVDFAKTKGIDFGQFGQGIGYLLNEYLKTLFATAPVGQ